MTVRATTAYGKAVPCRPLLGKAAKARSDHPAGVSRSRLATALLSCGVGYSLLYVIENDVVAARRYSGYSRMSQAVSELSAKGSPARPFLTATVPLSSALMVAFGIGVSKSAEGKRALRVAGGLLVGGGVMSVTWLPFPMSSRDEIAKGAGAANDIGHLVLSAATLVLILSQFAAGAVAFGRKFRVYSLLSGATVAGFGALTGIESQKMTRGEPTPWLGLFERIMLGAWLLWMSILAVILLRIRERPGPPRLSLD